MQNYQVSIFGYYSACVQARQLSGLECNRASFLRHPKSDNLGTLLSTRIITAPGVRVVPEIRGTRYTRLVRGLTRSK